MQFSVSERLNLMHSVHFAYKHKTCCMNLSVVAYHCENSAFKCRGYGQPHVVLPLKWMFWKIKISWKDFLLKAGWGKKVEIFYIYIQWDMTFHQYSLFPKLPLTGEADLLVWLLVLSERVLVFWKKRVWENEWKHLTVHWGIWFWQQWQSSGPAAGSSCWSQL